MPIAILYSSPAVCCYFSFLFLLALNLTNLWVVQQKNLTASLLKIFHKFILTLHHWNVLTTLTEDKTRCSIIPINCLFFASSSSCLATVQTITTTAYGDGRFKTHCSVSIPLAVELNLIEFKDQCTCGEDDWLGIESSPLA